MRFVVTLVLVVCSGCSTSASTPATTMDDEVQAELELALQIDAAWGALTDAEQRAACAATDAELRRRLLPVIGVEELERALRLTRDHC